jgi:hypothetical protein
LLKNVHLLGGSGDVCEDELGIENLGINLSWGQESLANNENFSRDSTRGLWLSRNNPLEQLVKNPKQFVVLSGAEDLSYKPTTRLQKLSGKLGGREGKLGLSESVLCPFGTNIRSSVMKDSVKCVARELQMFFVFCFSFDAKASRRSTSTYTSALAAPMVRLISCLHLGVVISVAKLVTWGMGLIGSKSRAIICLLIGMYLVAT